MTKLAYGCESLADLGRRLRRRHAAEGKAYLVTRYRPRRHAEMIGGSLYWILAHRIVARSEILAFEEAPEGRTRIVLSPRLVPVAGRRKRAHQGWRYLEPRDAPRDLAQGEADLSALPPRLMGELTRLGLV
ncbi:MAG: DUF1489 family protein [Sphingomonadaceae bacterium]